MSKYFLKTIVTIALFAPLGFANAQTTATDPMTVSATVEASCTVVANDMLFGTYNPFDTTDTDQTATVDVTCSNGAAYNIGLGLGTKTGATVTTRGMTGGTGSDILNYALYSDTGRTSNWGDTVDTDTVSDTGSGSMQSTTVYGRIPQGQTTAPVGSYTDTVTVTVTY